MTRLSRFSRRIVSLPYRRMARGGLVLLASPVVFRLVFGRWPNRDELQLLKNAVQQQQPTSFSSLCRTVLSIFDQKNYFTPFSVRLTAGDVHIVDYAGVKIAVDVAEPVISHEIRHNTYERHMVNFFQRVLRPGMKMIDIGANIGLFSLLAAKQVGPTGRVYSVEPRGENARLLLYSATLNRFDNIRLLPTAVGDNTGYTLYQSHIGANGALMTKPRDEDFGSQAILHPTSQVVPMARLDNLISGPIDLIKLDIEGAEGMALRGAMELIQSYRPMITSEASMEMLERVSNMALRDYLLLTRNLNYRQFVIERADGRLEEVQDLDNFLALWPDPCHILDFAFVPVEKMEMLAPLLEPARRSA